MINPLTLPLSATLFIPQGDRNGESLNMGMDMGMDPFILPYHIIPQRLTFSDLQLLNTNTRLPTLLTAKTILITNTSTSNFTLDDSPITQPDVYTTNAVTVHGIATLLDYNIYGDEDSLNVALPIPPPPPQLQDIPPAPPFAEAGSTTSSHDHDHDHDHYHYHAYSHAARLCLWSSEFSIVFLNIVLSACLAFNIHQD
ncbi:fas1 domain-containing protein [Fagus crenata]